MIRFHCPGIPHSAKKYNIIAGLERLAELGIDGIEIPFTHGVRMSLETATKVRAKAEELGLSITLHGPFWINLSAEGATYDKSLRHILATIEKGAELGARSITFHAAYYQKHSPEEVFAKVQAALTTIVEAAAERNISHVQIAPEVTGKPSQFGDVEELVALSQSLHGNTSLCIDFSHLYARTQGIENGTESFRRTLTCVREGMGGDALSHLQMHLSGMVFGPKGERKHRSLAEEDELEWKKLLEVLKEENVSGWMAVETPDLEESTLLAQQYYQSL